MRVAGAFSRGQVAKTLKIDAQCLVAIAGTVVASGKWPWKSIDGIVVNDVASVKTKNPDVASAERMVVLAQRTVAVIQRAWQRFPRAKIVEQGRVIDNQQLLASG
jgi:hypothetical protein